MSDNLIINAVRPEEPCFWVKFRYFCFKNPLLLFGSVIILGLLLCAVFAPYIAPYEPNVSNFSLRLQPPSPDHLMGTDQFGRDIFSRVVFGSRTSIIIGGTVLFISILIGVPLGVTAGYFGGRTDMVLMRITDVFLAFPALILPITISAALGAGLFNAMMAIAVSWLPWYSRIVRGSVLSVKEELYVKSAQVTGSGHLKIILRHVLPNAWTPVVVQASMDFGYTILAAASLSFIGIGAKPPDIEWGLMIAGSRSHFIDCWWTVICPGSAIFLTVLAANFLGDGIRDLLDPKQRSV